MRYNETMEYKLEKFPFFSKILSNERDIRVYFPSGEGPYPVLFVHDGEVAFRRDTPEGWESLEIDQALGERELVVVAIAALPWQERTKEYSPFPWNHEAEKWLPKGEEKGEKYLRFLMEELIPYIESHYPVSRKREQRFMMGCSLGAQISVYASAAYPDSFSKIGCFSLASWGNEEAFLAYLRENHPRKDTSFFVRVGTEEGIPRDLASYGCCYPEKSQNLLRILKEIGIQDVDFLINQGRRHKTIEWSKDMPRFLAFLLNEETRN